MKRLDIERKEIDKKDFVRRTAKLSDVSKHIKEDVVIYENDEPVLLYRTLPKKKISVIRLPEFEKEGFKPKDRVFKKEDAF